MAWKTKEEAKAYNDSYRARNSERIRQQKREAYAKDPEKFRKQRADWRKNNPQRCLQIELRMQAKKRAEDQGVPFNLSVDDIVVPDLCPILGIKLERNTKAWAHAASPTLDKIIPSLGYVKDNIVVISHRANVVKGNSSLEELAAVLSFYS